MSLRSVDFSATKVMYALTFAVVGTKLISRMRYSVPPMPSSVPRRVSSASTVTRSIGRC